MRNFFIRSFDVLIAIIAILLILGVLFATYTVAKTPATEGLDPAALDAMGPLGGVLAIFGGGGLVPALFVFVGGMLYTIIVVGFLYIGTGIYINTKRTADAVQEMLNR